MLRQAQINALGVSLAPSSQRALKASNGGFASSYRATLAASTGRPTLGQLLVCAGQRHTKRRCSNSICQSLRAPHLALFPTHKANRYFRQFVAAVLLFRHYVFSKSPGKVKEKNLSRFYSPDAVLVTGLGKLRNLDDELLMQVLSLLPADSLGRLACVNCALYCFSNHDDLWRALTLEASQINTDVHQVR